MDEGFQFIDIIIMSEVGRLLLDVDLPLPQLEAACIRREHAD